MINFREFLKDGAPLHSVSVDIGLNEETTRDRINANFDELLSERFINPYSGWVRLCSYLSEHNVVLPKIVFRDIFEGEEIFILEQGDEDFFLVFQYRLNEEDSQYDVQAFVVNNDEMDELLKEDEEEKPKIPTSKGYQQSKAYDSTMKLHPSKNWSRRRKNEKPAPVKDITAQYKAQHEEFEEKKNIELDELSMSTIKSYHKKAKEGYVDKYGRELRRDPQRNAGLNRAGKRMRGHKATS